jgi:exonuclease SbcD
VSGEDESSLANVIGLPLQAATYRERKRMKIIHTSDWHIGREFESESLAGDQLAFIEWLVETVRSHSVDLVIIAGDVWDKAVPKGEAIELLDTALSLLVDAGAQVLLIPGNHDSAQRLDFGATRQGAGGVHILAKEMISPQLQIVRCGDQEVAVIGIPYLDPHRVPAPNADDAGQPRARTHQNVLADALDRARSMLDEYSGLASIVVAHAFVAGSSTSDSERHNVGGADRVDVALFDGFDYVALGHLHRPQELGRPSIAYSGSPLPYSFSEDHQKSVRLIKLRNGAPIEVATIDIPVGRPVHTVTGTLDELLTDSALTSFEGHWIAARLTNEQVVLEPMQRLRRRFPHVTSVAYVARTRQSSDAANGQSPSLVSRAPEETVKEFLQEMRDHDWTDSERDLVFEATRVAAEQES